MSQHPHVVLPGSHRPMKAGAQRVREVDQDKVIQVTITLRGPEMPAPGALPEKGLTPQEFSAQFAASQQDADQVSKVLVGYGLKVDEVSLETRSMQVSGPISAFEAAFAPQLAIYHCADQGEFRGREGELKLPAPLAGIVTGVFGLDTRRVAKRRPLTAGGIGLGLASHAHATAHATGFHPLTPADVESLYRFPPGDGAGQTIAIAEFGGAYYADDVQTYCTRQGRAVPAVTAVSINGQPAFTLDQVKHLPASQRQEVNDEAVEVMMDVEIIAGLCPKAHVTLLFSTFDQKGWVDLINRVITDRPVALSVSWGAPEDDATTWSAAARSAVNLRLAAAAALGITVCVASGDDGSGDEIDDGRAHVDFPGSSPYVLSVGGTMLQGTPAHPSEVVWFEAPGRRTQTGGGATGGGVSVEFPRPSFQNVSVPSINQGASDGRVMPDVAAVAGSPYYSLALRDQHLTLHSNSFNGGTSASAPVWASLVARINAKLPAAKQQRFLTPLLYGNDAGGHPIGTTAFRDVTSGQNASSPSPGVGYSASAGFDAVSGWGAPDGTKLLAALS